MRPILLFLMAVGPAPQHYPQDNLMASPLQPKVPHQRQYRLLLAARQSSTTSSASSSSNRPSKTGSSSPATLTPIAVCGVQDLPDFPTAGNVAVTKGDVPKDGLDSCRSDLEEKAYYRREPITVRGQNFPMLLCGTGPSLRRLKKDGSQAEYFSSPSDENRSQRLGHRGQILLNKPRMGKAIQRDPLGVISDNAITQTLGVDKETSGDR
ncbi:hypothetical protein DL767_001167 [Monosporascus sp. MG133]|nr:hypothetical protein DL767_001167 [Monosporascus sp. MG133]